MDKLKLSVLLVEDDKLSLYVYSEFMRNVVTDVYLASDGLEGLELFKERRPHIIITDIRMPGMDGLAMIREIKKIDPDVKVIMISGHSEADYFIRSIDLGVDGYLLKPVDNKRLENKIIELGRNILLRQKVAESEKKFRDFAELLPQVVFEASTDGRLTFVNRFALEKLNYTDKDFERGLSLQDVIIRDGGRRDEKIMDIITRDINQQEKEVMCRTRKGKFFPALIYTSGIIENGQLAGIRGVMVDISSRKKMLEELQTLNQELEKKVLERPLLLSNEIREKEKAEKALIQAKEKAEESDKMKGIFLANVSHEIQTPIKAIISFSNLLQSTGLSDERRLELTGIIESNSNALLNLTNDILEFTKLQANVVKLFRIDFDVTLFLEELFPLFESHRSRELGRDIRLKLTIPRDHKVLLINSDPSRLKQIFSNLISNAYKFTQEGYVEYGFNVKEGNRIRFFVRDTGFGISKKYQRKIFDRFIQEPQSLNIKREGTGLGLAISQSLIRMLGGEIWVESEPGKGSSFYFEFPEIIVDKNISEESREYVWKDKQILIIEDDISDYIALEEILKNRVKIHYLDSHAHALEFCKNNSGIHLCLFHWSKNSDTDLIDGIRAGNPKPGILAMLEAGFPARIKKSLRKSFDGFIRKPLVKDEVLIILDRHLG
jgi:PAS domain S-box-containing protein